MSLEDTFWSFLNENSGHQVDAFNFAQAELLFAHIAPSERTSWLFWREGLLEWTPLAICEDFPNAHVHAPPPLPTPQNKISYEADRRHARRLERHYQVEITGSGGGTFQTTTLDVSMGGIRLKDVVPVTLGRSFELKLTQPGGKSIKLFCSLLKIPKDSLVSQRVRIVGTNQEGVLRAWLKDPA
jgi:hypothetical protein